MVKKIKQKAAWNKGKIVGRKPALVSTQVTAIKTVMAEQSVLRDRAMFPLPSTAAHRCQRRAGHDRRDICRSESEKAGHMTTQCCHCLSTKRVQNFTGSTDKGLLCNLTLPISNVTVCRSIR
ncbi:hypothetical protein OAN307_c03530 [Octadecabacter antarcticus 307]|uniref:Uncharacterized protein n=1 Tax=Octadecabacter antarcticus 307 TaxID=391626 RepID=M9R700_9RHOB|nr:hypothetical protein OAN307_c03530 [Octadecabacter antarcticus 307]